MLDCFKRKTEPEDALRQTALTKSVQTIEPDIHGTPLLVLVWLARQSALNEASTPFVSCCGWSLSPTASCVEAAAAVLQPTPWQTFSPRCVLHEQHSDSYSGFSGYFLWKDSIVPKPEWLKPCTSVEAVSSLPNCPVHVTFPSALVVQPPIMFPSTGRVPSYS